MSTLEMQKQSPGSHRSVATRFNNEAENIMSKDQDTISEADIKRLNQKAEFSGDFESRTSRRRTELHGG